MSPSQSPAQSPAQSPVNFIRHFMTTVWDEGKIESLNEFVTPDYVDRAYNGGAESLAAQVKQAREAFSESRHVIEDVVTEGDRIMLRASLQGIHTGPFRGIGATNAAIDVRVARWFRLEGGRIAEHWALLDTIGLFHQIGARPPAPAAKP